MYCASISFLSGSCIFAYAHGSSAASNNPSGTPQFAAALNLQAETGGTPTSTFPASTISVAAFSSSTLQVPGLTTPANTDGIPECSPIGYGHGPRPTDDTMLAFLENSDFSVSALNAPVPSGYTPAYTNERASSISDNYLMHSELQDYGTTNCSKQCDRTTGCEAFNIYFERSPTLNLGLKCKTSLSSTIIKCVLWGSKLDRLDATNRGHMQWDFSVVIAGSNAYNKGTAREKGATKDTVTGAASSTVAPRLAMVLLLGVFAFLFCH